MQPQTLVKFNGETFNHIKKSIKLKSKAGRQRQKNPTYAAKVPEEIGIQLTHRCNLRCKHCFQWNEQGFFHRFDKEKQKADLDISIIEKLLWETRENKSNLYIWGGEPLIHRHWDAVADLIEKDPRWTVLCTNGLLLEKKLESILRISSHLALLISIDGLEEQNDSIRGSGTFNRLMDNIKLLLSLQQTGQYKGKISLNCVLSDGMVDKLYDFMEYAEMLGVDTLYFCFPWYISKNTALQMDQYFNENFSWLHTMDTETKASWHSYTYHLNLSKIDQLKQELEKLNARQWRIRIRLQPALEIHELEDFLKGREKTAQKRCQCLAISNRMDVLADGHVSACKIFDQFIIGSLHDQGVIEIWQSERFSRVRGIINRRLMPVCSKCILLYLNGI
ncbi:MAG: radical SAM protein [Desulfobacterales bacterium]